MSLTDNKFTIKSGVDVGTGLVKLISSSYEDSDISSLIDHSNNTANPHSVTTTQLGLENVDNTADTDKPVSTNQQTALNLKADKDGSNLEVKSIGVSALDSGVATAGQVATAQGDGSVLFETPEGGYTDADKARRQRNEDNIATANLRSIDTATWINMNSGYADEFNDETAVNTALTDFSYDSGNKKYATPVSTGILQIQSIDQPNGGKDIQDSAGAYTVSFSGASIAHSTEQAKWGTSSIKSDFFNQHILIANEPEWTLTGDWNLRMWVYPTNTSIRNIVTIGDTPSVNSIRVYSSGNNAFCVIKVDSSTVVTLGDLINDNLPLNQWSYIAISRQGNTFRLFENGIESNNSGIVYAGAMPTIAGSIHIGSYDGQPSAMYIDDFQFNTNQALDVIAHTPPTERLPAVGGDVMQNWISEVITANAQPSIARCLFCYDQSTDPIVFPTDLTAEISRDGGTTFESCNLSDVGDWADASHIISSDETDLTAQPAGTSMVLKISARSAIASEILRVYLKWD